MKLGDCVALGYHPITSSRSMSTKAQLALAQAKKAPGTSLRINIICNF